MGCTFSPLEAAKAYPDCGVFQVIFQVILEVTSGLWRFLHHLEMLKILENAEIVLECRDLKLLDKGEIIISTPEKWNALSRCWRFLHHLEMLKIISYMQRLYWELFRMLGNHALHMVTCFLKGLIHYYTSHKGLIHYIDLHKSHEPFFAYVPCL